MERNKTEQAAKWLGIGKLAELIYETANDAYEQMTARETIAEIRTDLKARLEPLLQAAENACEVHAEKHPTSCIHRLAKEIESWRK